MLFGLKQSVRWQKNRTKPFNTEIMLSDNLHCTSHVVTERDQQYDIDWFQGETEETVKCNKMFWTENVCVLSVELEWELFFCYLIAGQSVPVVERSGPVCQRLC